MRRWRTIGSTSRGEYGSRGMQALTPSTQQDPEVCTPSTSSPPPSQVRPTNPGSGAQKSLHVGDLAKSLGMQSSTICFTWVFILICAGEPHKLCRGTPAGADDIDKSAVNVELKVTSICRGHEVFDAHQVFSRRRSFRDGEVELDSKSISAVSTRYDFASQDQEEVERTSDTRGQSDQCRSSEGPAYAILNQSPSPL